MIPLPTFVDLKNTFCSFFLKNPKLRGQANDFTYREAPAAEISKVYKNEIWLLYIEEVLVSFPQFLTQNFIP